MIEVSNIPREIILSLSRSQLRSWVRMIRGMKALFDALDRQMREESGMSHDDYIVLTRLYRAEDRAMRMSHLAAELSSSPSRLSHIIARLEGRGWVERTRAASDRRVVLAGLTEAGGAKLREASPGHLALVERLVFETLGDHGVSETAQSLDLIRRAAEDLG
jgi:DNA-binding MarR family transcriptional regulator